MDTTAKHDHATLLNIVRQWPDEERVAFIQELLQMFLTHAREKKPTVEEAFGMAGIENPPTDAEVKQWLDEHRQEKYG